MKETLIAIAITVTVYLFAAFAAWDLNAGNWDIPSRAAIGVLAIAFSVLGVGAYKANK